MVVGDEAQLQYVSPHSDIMVGKLTIFFLDLKVSVVKVHCGNVGVVGVDDRAHTHCTEWQFSWNLRRGQRRQSHDCGCATWKSDSPVEHRFILH